MSKDNKKKEPKKKGQTYMDPTVLNPETKFGGGGGPDGGKK